jgi:hypothetical protein
MPPKLSATMFFDFYLLTYQLTKTRETLYRTPISLQGKPLESPSLKMNTHLILIV